MNFDAEVEKAIKRIQELAEDGKPPSLRIYDANRAGCFCADVFTRRGIPWLQLVEMAGFTVRRIEFGTVEEEIEKAIVKMREIAVDGMAPTKKEYDKARGDCYASEALRETCKMSWRELVSRAGLEPLPTGVQKGTIRQNGRRLRDVEQEIDDAKEEAMQATQRERSYLGLPVFDQPRRVWQANGKTFVAWGVR